MDHCFPTNWFNTLANINQIWKDNANWRLIPRGAPFPYLHVCNALQSSFTEISSLCSFISHGSFPTHLFFKARPALSLLTLRRLGFSLPVCSCKFPSVFPSLPAATGVEDKPRPPPQPPLQAAIQNSDKVCRRSCAHQAPPGDSGGTSEACCDASRTERPMVRSLLGSWSYSRACWPFRCAPDHSSYLQESVMLQWPYSLSNNGSSCAPG